MLLVAAVGQAVTSFLGRPRGFLANEAWGEAGLVERAVDDSFPGRPRRFGDRLGIAGGTTVVESFLGRPLERLDEDTVAGGMLAPSPAADAVSGAARVAVLSPEAAWFLPAQH